MVFLTLLQQKISTFAAAIMKIQDLLQLYARSLQAAALAKILEDKTLKTVFLQGLVASGAPVMFAAVAQQTSHPILFVLQDADEAGYFYHDLTQLLGDGGVLFFQVVIAAP